MTDTLEQTVIDLVGVNTSHMEIEKSLFRAEYTERERWTLDGAVNYDEYDDPLLNARRSIQRVGAVRPSLNSKIWVHRANSLGKLSEVMEVFPGAELDVVYDDVTGRLQIRHPPVADIGLDLEEVLGFLEMNEAETRLWLDFKNLDETNLHAVLARLSDLDQQYGLKERVIIETTYTGEGFKEFVADNFYTSYYLPTEEVLFRMKTGDVAQLQRLANQVIDVVRRHRAKAISFDISLYDFVQEHLGEFAAVNGLDYLTWELSVNSSRSGFVEEIVKQDLDERIKVLLVPFTSRFGI